MEQSTAAEALIPRFKLDKVLNQGPQLVHSVMTTQCLQLL